jgi:ubiquinone biosynthesis protein COQ9
MTDVPPKLLQALLAHVPFDGWSQKALERAATDCSLSTTEAQGHFPRGTEDMLEAWLAAMDAELAVALDTQIFHSLKVREKITTAVRTRLERAEPHREAVRRAAALLAHPRFAALSARSLWRTADVMWRAAGDKATDFNHYSKRLILGGVYTATLLVWLQDDSDGRAETWGFLDRRIAGVLRFEKAKAHLLEVQDTLPSLSRFLGRLRYPAA